MPTGWQLRIPAMLGRYFWHGFSQPHIELWEWAEAINSEASPRPFIALWPRGRGKSTMAESVAVDCGVRKARTYCMYVSGTQDQADKHVQTIARMLELDTIAQFAPGIGKPKISQNGNRTWNRAMVSTSTGYTVEAIGLNKAVRGQKIDWARPDLIIFDDVDEKHDTEVTTAKKEEIITDSILPAGGATCAVLFAQNLVHSNSIAHRLSKQPSKEGAASYLIDRIVSGPYRAVDDLKYDLRQVGDIYRWAVTGGKSIWQGFDKDICEGELNRVGPTAYERESQNNVDVDNPHALMSAADFERTRVSTHPDLVRVAVAVDPPGGATECGIVAGGKALVQVMVNGKTQTEWHGYTLEDATQPAGVTPEKWALEVLKCYHRNKADVIFVERNYGGDMVASTIRQAKWTDDEGNVIVNGGYIHIEEVNATRGKQVRAEPIAIVFQQGRGHHVGHFSALEKEWRQWVPGDTNSPNRCFVAGTMIETIDGSKPIETIEIGDYVLTRNGYHPVVNCGITSHNTPVLRLTLSCGTILECTEDHPLYVPERGFVEAWKLKNGDPLLVLASKVSGLMELSSDATQIVQAKRQRAIFSRLLEEIGQRVSSLCIDMFGRKNVVKFLRDTIFITKTAISETIPLIIWKSYREKSTESVIREMASNVNERRWIMPVLLPQSGTGANQALSGIGSTANRRGEIETPSRWFVPNAEKVIRGGQKRKAFIFVLSSALAAITNRIAGILRIEFASSAEVLSTSKNPAVNRFALASVVGSFVVNSAPVYNLTVANQPEYFANGVLVHNCDAETWLYTGLMLGEVALTIPLLQATVKGWMPQ